MTFHAFLQTKYPLYSDTEIRVNLTVQHICELVQEFITAPVCEDRVICIDTIICPNCEKIQEADVTQNLNEPFPTYIKNCECGYTIMESEWDLV